jgi:hypothetical protein
MPTLAQVALRVQGVILCLGCAELQLGEAQAWAIWQCERTVTESGEYADVLLACDVRRLEDRQHAPCLCNVCGQALL